MNQPASRKLVLLLTAVALLTGSFILTVPDTAEAARMCECDYYSDASHTTIIGGLYQGCRPGQVSRWGSSSPYYSCTCEPCG